MVLLYTIICKIRQNLQRKRGHGQKFINAEILKLAKAFEASVVLHSALKDPSLRVVAQDNGVIPLHEAGEALRLNETAIKIGSKRIVNILKALEMLPKTK